MGRCESQIGLLERPVPQVIIKPELLESDVPYTVSVDKEACGRFLQAHGMNEKKIPKRQIVLARTIGSSSEHNNLYGQYWNKRITLACDHIWKSIQIHEQDSRWTSPTINSVFQHEAKHAIDATKPKTVISDRAVLLPVLGLGLPVLPVMLLLTREPLMQSFAVSIVAEGVGFFGLGSVLRAFDERFIPWERRANRFENEMKDDSRWHNLVTISSRAKP